MTRRTLDILLSTGGLIACLLLLVLAAVLQTQAGFAQDTVRQQLSEQKITFTAADKLTNQEKTWKPGSRCLVENGGKLLESGAQAECYADYYIALHLDEAATTAGYPGATYASIGATQTDLRSKLADARSRNDPQAASLQQQLDGVNALRTTQFQGETLRGLLLTSYGFSIFGQRAQLAALICFAIAALAALLALAGYIHAFRTPREQMVLGASEAPIR